MTPMGTAREIVCWSSLPTYYERRCENPIISFAGGRRVPNSGARDCMERGFGTRTTPAANVEAKKFQLSPDICVHKTCSIGFAPCPFSGDHPDLLNWEQIIDRADKALYAAKNSGRNRWVGLRGQTTSATYSGQERVVTTVVVEGEEYQCSSSHPLEPFVWSTRD